MAFCEQGIFLRLFYIKKEHGVRGFFIRKQRTLESKDSSVLIFTEIYLACFLLKTAVQFPLRNQEKKQLCFLKGNLLSHVPFRFSYFVLSTVMVFVASSQPTVMSIKLHRSRSLKYVLPLMV